MGVRVLHPKRVKARCQDVPTLGVFVELLLEEAALLRLLQADGRSLLERRVATEDDACCGRERGLNDGRRPNEPAYAPPGRGERLCGRGEGIET